MVSVFDLLGEQGAGIRTRLEKALSYSPLMEQTFGKFMAPNYVQTVREEGRPVGGMRLSGYTDAPIETLDALKSQGGTELLIPVKKHLTKPGVAGSYPLFGTGEADRIGFRRVTINEKRKAYAPPRGMEYQKTKQWAKKFVPQARQELQYHYSNTFANDLKLAALTGYSSELNQMSNIGGGSEPYISHPNFYVPGFGRQVGYDATTKTDYESGKTPYTTGYEANVQAAIDGLTSEAQGLTGKFVAAIAVVASNKRLKRIIMKDGFSFFPMFVKDTAYYQLWNDPEFRDVAKRIDNTSLAKTPLGNCEGAFYKGVVVYPDATMFCAYTATNNGSDTNISANTVQYGARPTSAYSAQGFKFNPELDTIDNGDRPCFILVGASALMVGTGEDLTITEEMQDHDKKYEIGYDVIQSIVRNDVMDTIGNITGTKGLFVENTSSVAGCTYSPSSIL
jgi:Protein of unknown function (DUF4043)